MTSRVLIIAVAVVPLLSPSEAAAQPNAAGWLAYRNGTQVPVIIQVSMIVNGQERRCQPHLMNPLEAAWDQVFGPGPKLITIYDPKSRQVLCQERINFAGKDLFFVIQLDPVAKGRLRLQPVADPRLMPGGLPGMFPGNPGLMPGGPNPGVLPRFTPAGGLTSGSTGRQG
jgi:hypothetical protein